MNDTLREQLETLKTLNRKRFDYIMARADCPDIATALEKSGMSRPTYYRFTPEEREQLETLAEQLHYEKTLQAWFILEGASKEAADVKVEGLRSRDQRIKQAAATEILDRTVGRKPTQQEQTITVKVDGMEELIKKLYGAQE